MSAERTRVAERTLTHFDDSREAHDAFSAMDDANLNPTFVTAPDGGGRKLPSNVRDGLSKANNFVAPVWLSRKLPLEWTDADACRKNVAKPGRHCCLFAPLACCHGSTDIINGFCAFHLRAIFNLTFMTDALYTLNGKGNAVIWFRNNCFVLDPRPVDDRMTVVFPLFELFESEPTKPDDISLFNLERYLVSINTPNWEKIYSIHVNFLFRLITVHSSLAQPQRPSREEQLIDNQLIMHWNVWNEYYSWILRQNPAEIYVFYADDKSDSLKTIPISKCTTLTQMIVRLFTEPYTRMDDSRFYSAPSSYGVYVRGHLAYSDNMCSYGTTTTENVTTTGALATLSMLRTDPCKTQLIQYDKGGQLCDENFCITSKINSNTKALNRAIMLSGDVNAATPAATPQNAVVSGTLAAAAPLAALPSTT